MYTRMMLTAAVVATDDAAAVAATHAHRCPSTISSRAGGIGWTIDRRIATSASHVNTAAVAAAAYDASADGLSPLRQHTKYFIQLHW